MKRVLLLTLLWLCLPPVPQMRAQVGSKTILSVDSPKDENGFFMLTNNWKYQPGDNMAWAETAIDDGDWEECVATELSSQRLPESGWNGIGWFRLHLEVAPALRNVPLALMLVQSGAAEIYLDGKLTHTIGRVAATREQEESIVSWEIWNPFLILFENGAEHVLAVRYSNSWSETVHREGFPAGFEMSIGDWQAGIGYHTTRTRNWTVYQMLFSGIALAFAILNLLLFFFYPRIKANLYYAIFTGSVAIFTYLVFELAFITDPARYLVWVQVAKIAVVFFVISGVRFLYELYYSRPPVQFRLLAAACLMICLGVVYIQIGLIYLFAMLVLMEMLRVVVRAILRKQDGALIIGVGFLVFIGATVYQILMSINVVDDLSGPFEVLFVYGIVGLLISMSVHLARNFARVNTKLEDYSRTLEQRVEARTQEVTAKNIELEETLHQLGASEERFRSVTQSANDAIIAADSSGTIVSWNQGAQTIFGYSEEEVSSKPLIFLMPERYRDKHQEGMKRLKATGKPRVIGKTVELHGLRKDGSEFPLELSLSTWSTEEGSFYSGIIRDITERKQAEAALQETQKQLVLQEKMASLGDLVAGVTHELNTPVGAMNSMHDTLTRAVDRLQVTLRESFPQEYEDNRMVQSVFKVIRDANRVMSTGVERVTAIVSSLRNFARLDEAEFQVADIHEGIESTLTLLQTQIGDGIRVVRDYADLKPIYCSPGQLNQAFMHLFKNAIEAIEEEGEIRVRTFLDNGTLCIQIRDTGVGIPTEQLERIFDFGFRTTDSRMRMRFGLPTAYKIVQEHKGEIKIVSEVGKGTEVTVSLATS
ncbi:MAG: PAS domain S-box protein [Verrucomicrobia bacterium]|nr:PAS domain S-box protein [Verrucomicrobiota bacterium]